MRPARYQQIATINHDSTALDSESLAQSLSFCISLLSPNLHNLSGNLGTLPRLTQIVSTHRSREGDN